GAQVWRMLATATERRVTKINFRQVIESLAPADLPPSTSDTVPLQHQIDWVETMLGNGYTNDAAAFYGREVECRQLYRWLVVDRCRLVTILGMGGWVKRRSRSNSSASYKRRQTVATKMSKPMEEVDSGTLSGGVC
ncbi:MAG: hypothetical protein HC778_05855, partial [Chamaesiphon sp. CSU_1_12]|nr:hypothetical protein [Chamaesiphon sp. CSU_1_12]